MVRRMDGDSEEQPISSGSSNGESSGDRDSRGRFQPRNKLSWHPGKSGNPDGRQPGLSITAELNKIMREGLEVDGKSKLDVRCAMARKAYQSALKGDFRFWNAIMERTEGKVREDVHVTTGLTMVLHPAVPPDDWYEKVRGLIGKEKGDPPIGELTA